MNIIVVGSGGRESALAWKLGKEGHKIFYSPGNGGSKHQVFFKSHEELASFAEKENCFTVVGPEAPLSEGIVDTFYEKELGIFGPTKKAALLETSKAFAKDFMKRHGIPTAHFKTFTDSEKAFEYAKENLPVVVKASGLAAGKGVMICNDERQAKDAIEKIMVKRALGEAGDKVVIEELLEGFEISYLAFTDGKTYRPLALSRDYKRALDDNNGPNTGGMGAYCPFTPGEIDGKILDWRIRKDIVERFIDGLSKDKLDYRGIIYFGIMVCHGKPYVLEFNCRFGDPETQVIIPRMSSALFPYMKACFERRLSKTSEIKWKKESSLCVVIASKGYPGSYKKGKDISIGRTSSLVFHAGTIKNGNNILTNGGRVINVVALGKDIADARMKAYNDAKKIKFDGMFFRRDIGK